MIQDKEERVYLSAVELAKSANCRLTDIYYWSRLGYLELRKSKEKGRLLYSSDQLPKAELMNMLTKKIGLHAEKASWIADQLLPLRKDNPEAFKVGKNLLNCLNSGILIIKLVNLLIEEGVMPRAKALLMGQEK